MRRNSIRRLTNKNDYIFSAITYSPYNGEEEINQREPKEILREIEQLEKKSKENLHEISKNLK